MMVRICGDDGITEYGHGQLKSFTACELELFIVQLKSYMRANGYKLRLIKCERRNAQRAARTFPSSLRLSLFASSELDCDFYLFSVTIKLSQVLSVNGHFGEQAVDINFNNTAVAKGHSTSRI